MAHKGTQIWSRKKWKILFYNDLDLQLRLCHIEHINVESAEMLNHVSEIYINEEKEELKNQRFKKKKITDPIRTTISITF